MPSGGALYALFSESNECSGVPGICLGTITTTSIGVCNIKMSMRLSEHRKTEENSFWGLIKMRNCHLRNEAVDTRPKNKKCPVWEMQSLKKSPEI